MYCLCIHFSPQYAWLIGVCASSRNFRAETGHFSLVCSNRRYRDKRWMQTTLLTGVKRIINRPPGERTRLIRIAAATVSDKLLSGQRSTSFLSLRFDFVANWFHSRDIDPISDTAARSSLVESSRRIPQFCYFYFLLEISFFFFFFFSLLEIISSIGRELIVLHVVGCSHLFTRVYTHNQLWKIATIAGKRKNWIFFYVL